MKEKKNKNLHDIEHIAYDIWYYAKIAQEKPIKSEFKKDLITRIWSCYEVLKSYEGLEL